MTYTTPAQTRTKGFFVSLAITLILLFASYVAGMYDEQVPIFLKGLTILLVIAEFFFTYLGGFYTIPTGKVGIKFWLGQAEKSHILTEGLHWQLPLGKWNYTHYYSNKEMLNTDDYAFENIACSNRTFVKISAKVQWRLLDPTKHLNQTSEDMASAYKNCILNAIANFINEQNINNHDIFGYKNRIENIMQNALEKLVVKFGETIDSVSIVINPMDTEWINIWRNQNEMSIIVDKATTLAKLNGISADEALRQIAIKEGWIKANESIYKIRDIEKIISIITGRL